MKKTFLLLALLFLEINIVSSQKKLDLYLLIGQSNMAGRATVEPQDTIENPRILSLNRDGKWEVAKEPLHFDKPGAGLGPGLAFAREILKANEKATIGLIPCAAGGSSIDHWLNDSYWEQTRSFPYNNALLRARLAMCDGSLKGILWHQGEAEYPKEKADKYTGKLIRFVQKLRSDLGAPDLPFIAGELPDFNGFARVFNPHLYEAKQEIANFEVVSASGFTAMSDGVHIDAQSERKFGKRYAEKMKLFLPDNGNPTGENIVPKTIRPARIFSDNMIIQRDKLIRIWGTSSNRKPFEVEFAGIVQKVKPQKDGRWTVEFPAMPASETAYQMTFAGDDNFSFNNILIGDVWICSGQSNMEWPVRKVFNSAYELAKADIPAIRSFTVPNEISLTPQSDFSSGRWNVATYENAANISAVAYFFAKNLYQTEKIPIGLICSYWGGTAVEAWTSLESISSHPDYAQPVEKLLATKNTPDFFDSLRIKSKDAYQQWQEKIKSIDPGYKEKWYSPEYQANEWFSMLAPAYWEDNGLADFDGVVWLRKDVYIPSQMLGKPLQLDMEILKDYDTTWFNGEEIGFTSWNAGRRIYTVPAGLIREGKNTIVVRLENIKGSGGFSSKHDSELYIKELMADKQALNIPLSGLWQFKPAMRTGDYPAKPQDLTSIHTPSCLYNAKIAPLTNLSVKGAIWYQGETNAFRACQYRSLFPLLISDWRKQFRQDFPFLFVQLAGHKAITKEPVEETWAELREAQTMTLSVPQTGMAVAIDLGDPSDVHPTHKQEVGRRLALEAEKIAYHKPEIITSPLYQKMQIEGNKIRLYFSGSDNGLIAKNGKLSGFAIADDSKKFVWANAEIEGNTVVVWNDNIQNPAAVRYAYAGSPVEGNGANLYNKERFPASPFRTDDWEWITLNNK